MHTPKSNKNDKNNHPPHTNNNNFAQLGGWKQKGSEVTIISVVRSMTPMMTMTTMARLTKEKMFKALRSRFSIKGKLETKT